MKEISELTAKFSKLLSSIDSLSQRERVLVFAAAMMVLMSFWHLGLMQPLLQQAKNKRAEIASQQERTTTLNRSLEDQVLQLSGTGAEYERRFALIQRRLDALNARLGDYASELIDPAEMARVLQGVLQEQSHLHLVRVRNFESEALAASAEAPTATFYKHGFEIEFEGSYFACLKYLQQIEALPWRFYWQLLELEVLDYPSSRIRVEVSTLSMNEEWIGA